MAGPGPLGECHRAGTGAGEDGAGPTGALDGGPCRRPRVERRDDVRVATRQVDERRRGEMLGEGRVRGGGRVDDAHRFDDGGNAGVRGHPAERRHAIGRRDVRSATSCGRRHDSDAHRPVSPRGQLEQGQQHEFVAGQELAASMQRDGSAHGTSSRGSASTRPRRPAVSRSSSAVGCRAGARRRPRNAPDPVRRGHERARYASSRIGTRTRVAPGLIATSIASDQSTSASSPIVRGATPPAAAGVPGSGRAGRGSRPSASSQGGASIEVSGSWCGSAGPRAGRRRRRSRRPRRG